jgi:hypothetical protein
MPNVALNTARRALPPACLAAAVLLMLVSGCARQASDQIAPESEETRTAQKGPVKLTFTVAPTDLDFSQRAEVRVEVVSPPDLTVNVRDYGRLVREGDHRFEIGVTRAPQDPPRSTEAGKLVSVYRYELGFFLPGEYELPPAAVSFIDDRDVSDDPDSKELAAAPELEELETEPVSITVRDTGGRQLSQEELRELETLPPVELPTVWSRWWWVGPVGAVVVIALIVLLVPPVRRLLVRYLTRSRKEKVIVVPAHVWARQQLAALAAEDLVGKGLIQEFHYRISYIVRGYIERRYDVSAGEMTTEEFLGAVVGDSRFGPETTAELQRFLSACDLVKYARHEPTSKESGSAFKAAETFVERTRADRATGKTTSAESAVVEERAA